MTRNVDARTERVSDGCLDDALSAFVRLGFLWSSLVVAQGDHGLYVGGAVDGGY